VRLAILTDLHANAEALAAVLREVHRSGIRRALCLGDLVGYNAFPRETLALVRDRGILSVHGNHDLMAIGRLGLEGCGPRARRAIAWTRTMLTPDDIAYLAQLPAKLRQDDTTLLVHSTLSDPVMRLQTEGEFRAQHRLLKDHYPKLEICFTGHTHEQGAVEITAQGEFRAHEVDELPLRQGGFYFVNPGSVGEPRGSDQRAAYVEYDVETRTLTFHRTAYDRQKVVRENVRQGLLGDVDISPGTSLRLRAVAAARAVATRLLHDPA